MTPLYARLPRGPHRMEPGEVAANQRQRMHGAMVQAVAANGYGATSVKQVISLAGVSRRAFYEQFSNKQECFLATLELLASRASDRIGAAYRSSDGNIEDRMLAAIRTFAELLSANPKSAHMVLVDAPSAGAPGWTRLNKTLLRFERTLFDSFARTPGATPLPAPVVRGITGGLHMIAYTRLRDQRAGELPSLVQEILEWTLAYQSPLARRLQQELHRGEASRSFGTDGHTGRRGKGERARTPSVRGPAQAKQPPGPDAERLRLLDSALRTIAEEGYGNLSPLQIADRAGTSIDTFFGLFGDMENCVSVALANLSEEVRETLSKAELDSQRTWPSNVKRALLALMRHFAERPGHAHMIATGAVEMGSPGIDLSLELANDLGRTLTSGAPEPSSGVIVHEAIAGAIWHTIYCHVARDMIERLPAAADALTYIVLAPFLGADQAIESISAEYPRHDASAVAERSARSGERHGSAAAF